MTAPVLAAGLFCAAAVWAALPPTAHLGDLAGRADRPAVARDAERAGGRPPGRSLSRLAAALGVGLGALALLGTALGLVVAPVAGAAAWRWAGRLEPRAARRRREQLTRAVPQVVDLLAATLTAGLAPAEAVDRVADALDAPMREELTALSARLRLGLDPVTTWREIAGHPQLGPVGRCVHRAVESGASVADAMTRLAEEQREANRTDVERRARGVGVRAAVPLGVCLLPAFVLVGVVPLVAGSLPVVLGR